MEQTSITAEGVIDTFLVLLIGIGPKIALVPFLQITASLDTVDQAAGTTQDAGHGRVIFDAQDYVYLTDCRQAQPREGRSKHCEC